MFARRLINAIAKTNVIRCAAVSPVAAQSVATRSLRTAAALRSATAASQSIEQRKAAMEAEHGVPVRESYDGTLWADYRPEYLRNLKVDVASDGTATATLTNSQGATEVVVLPDLEPTIEWVLSTPIELHLFEESPIVKMYEEEGEEW